MVNLVETLSALLVAIFAVVAFTIVYLWFNLRGGVRSREGDLPLNRLASIARKTQADGRVADLG